MCAIRMICSAGPVLSTNHVQPVCPRHEGAGELVRVYTVQNVLEAIDADPEKIRDLAQRGKAWGNLVSKQALKHAIEKGRGGIDLKLTPEQYARPKRP
jgi:hypothetical protein